MHVIIFVEHLCGVQFFNIIIINNVQQILLPIILNYFLELETLSLSTQSKNNIFVAFDG